MLVRLCPLPVGLLPVGETFRLHVNLHSPTATFAFASPSFNNSCALAANTGALADNLRIASAARCPSTITFPSNTSSTAADAASVRFLATQTRARLKTPADSALVANPFWRALGTAWSVRPFTSFIE